MNSNQNKGKNGETIAVQFLTEKGYQILERNWRHHHLEVDIIASYQGILHIIEVKTRHSLRYGLPEESITKNKMRFLKNAGEAFQFKNPCWKYIQFDVIAISLLNELPQEIFLLEDVYF
jgi:putative endonuclease